MSTLEEIHACLGDPDSPLLRSLDRIATALESRLAEDVSEQPTPGCDDCFTSEDGTPQYCEAHAPRPWTCSACGEDHAAGDYRPCRCGGRTTDAPRPAGSAPGEGEDVGLVRCPECEMWVDIKPELAVARAENASLAEKATAYGAEIARLKAECGRLRQDLRTERTDLRGKLAACERDRDDANAGIDAQREEIERSHASLEGHTVIAAAQGERILETETLAEQAESALAQCREMTLAYLRKVEWTGLHDGGVGGEDTYDACRVCGHRKAEGHFSDCAVLALRAALAPPSASGEEAALLDDVADLRGKLAAALRERDEEKACRVEVATNLSSGLNKANDRAYAAESRESAMREALEAEHNKIGLICDEYGLDCEVQAEIIVENIREDWFRRAAQDERIELLNAEVGSLTMIVAKREGSLAALTEKARAFLSDFDGLVEASLGVYGLHQNGDGAPWDSLLPGGYLETWLLSIDALRAALAPGAPAPECETCGEPGDGGGS